MKTVDYSKANEMQINYKKTKVLIFNPCTYIDFMQELSVENNDLEVVDEMRLLDLIIRLDMKGLSTTENMVMKANKRLWMRRLRYPGANELDLEDIYTKQIRSVVSPCQNKLT